MSARLGLLSSLLPRIAVLCLAGIALCLAGIGPLEAAGLQPGRAALVAALVTSAVMTWALHWTILRRVRRLNRGLAEVAAGDLQPLLQSRSGDEIGQLTGSINAIVTTLRDNYDELRTNEELRRRLVANVSHELRTPLTSIQGYLETALNSPDRENVQVSLEICHRETRKLGRLVQDLFQLSKLDTHQLEFHFETVSLVELADQVGLAFEQRMIDKEIEFATSFTADEPLDVVADGNRLGQVITNLLGNAVVFTPPGGQVTLSCVREDGSAVCRVIDTGIGIGERDLPHIFDSFFHLEKSRTRNLGGTGLGLAICKAIIDAHGGELSVESRVGEGTTFSFRLDLAELPDDD